MCSTSASSCTLRYAGGVKVEADLPILWCSQTYTNEVPESIEFLTSERQDIRYDCLHCDVTDSGCIDVRLRALLFSHLLTTSEVQPKINSNIWIMQITPSWPLSYTLQEFGSSGLPCTIPPLWRYCVPQLDSIIHSDEIIPTYSR